jgi:hypothetical protein
MGCDIYIEAHKLTPDGGYTVDLSFIPFDWRDYGMFGFLAGVRNYSEVPPISPPRGLPYWVERQGKRDGWYGVEADEYGFRFGDHSFSFLYVKELLDFNYEQTFENRRCTINGNGGSTCLIGEGEVVTFREFLGEEFFSNLDTLQEKKIDAIVFGFDS